LPLFLDGSPVPRNLVIRAYQNGRKFLERMWFYLLLCPSLSSLFPLHATPLHTLPITVHLVLPFRFHSVIVEGALLVVHFSRGVVSLDLTFSALFFLSP
jgi:hypothetical protein